MRKIVMPAGKIEQTVFPTPVQVKPNARTKNAESPKGTGWSPSKFTLPEGRVERTVLRQIEKRTSETKTRQAESPKGIPKKVALTQSPVHEWLVTGVLQISLDPVSIENCAAVIKENMRSRARSYRVFLRNSVAFWYQVAVAIFHDPACFEAIKDAPFIREARLGKCVDGRPAREPPPLKREDLCAVMLQVGFNKHEASAYYCRLKPFWRDKVEARRVLNFLRENGLRNSPRQSGNKRENGGVSAVARSTATSSSRACDILTSPGPDRQSGSSNPVQVKVSLSGVLLGTVSIAAKDVSADTFVVISTVKKTASGALKAVSVLQ